jgi:CRISPR-associated DxTHG motif protein
MKIICFLGPSDYQQTTYVWKGQECVTRFFPVAMAQFMPPERILVFATPAVRLSPNLAEMCAILDEKGLPWQVVDIPEGHSEADLWVIFDALTGRVESGETVSFDVTHSFRSLPFLAFLAVAYLRIARNVHVERVLYGAWEARTQPDNRSPVYDLTPFVGLLDWITATDQFVQTGNARQLAGLLNPQGQKGGAAARASRTLSSVSMAAFLCQPFELMRSARELESTLQNAESELEISAKPFGLLREQIVSKFGRFNADYQTDPRAALCQEFQLLEWYFEIGQLMQAITLAREWFIDAVAFRLDGQLDFSRDVRISKERAISGLSQIGRRDEDSKKIFAPEDLSEAGKAIWEWPEHDLIKKTWSAIQEPRNTLDHAGHRSSLYSIEIIQRKVKNEILPGLLELAQQWDLC